MSLPKPNVGVMVCITQTTEAAAPAPRAHISSKPKLRCMIATDVRMKTAMTITTPDTMDVMNRRLVLSRTGWPHIVAVVFTATRPSLTVHVPITQPWIAALRGASLHMHATSVGAHFVWFMSADWKHVACRKSVMYFSVRARSGAHCTLWQSGLRQHWLHHPTQKGQP